MDEQEAQETAGAALAVEEAEETAAPPASPSPPVQDQTSLDLVIDLPVRMTVELGRAELLMRDVLALGTGSVLELDRGTNDPADVLVNGRLIARGDLTSVDDRIAIRIVELVRPTGRGSGEG